jgi:hypothetical protein
VLSVVALWRRSLLPGMIATWAGRRPRRIFILCEAFVIASRLTSQDVTACGRDLEEFFKSTEWAFDLVIFAE